MALENYTGFIKDIVVTNPVGTDPKSQGDDHFRGVKLTLQVQFAGFTDGISITVTESELNQLPQLLIDFAALLADYQLAGENIVVDGAATPQVKVQANTIDTTIAAADVNNSVYVTGTGPRNITLAVGGIVGQQRMIINKMADDEVLNILPAGGDTIDSKQGAATNPVLSKYGDSIYLVRTEATVWTALAPA